MMMDAMAMYTESFRYERKAVFLSCSWHAGDSAPTPKQHWLETHATGDRISQDEGG